TAALVPVRRAIQRQRALPLHAQLPRVPVPRARRRPDGRSRRLGGQRGPASGLRGDPMRRLVCRAFDGADGVGIERAAEPTPAANEVLLRVAAANVTFVDRLIVTGRYQVKPPLPFTPGAVGAGEVVAVGPHVRDVVPGMRVVALKPNYGLWASHAV